MTRLIPFLESVARQDAVQIRAPPAASPASRHPFDDALVDQSLDRALHRHHRIARFARDGPPEHHALTIESAKLRIVGSGPRVIGKAPQDVFLGRVIQDGPAHQVKPLERRHGLAQPAHSAGIAAGRDRVTARLAPCQHPAASLPSVRFLSDTGTLHEAVPRALARSTGARS